MLELPEAANIARQISDNLVGKRIAEVIAAHTPHRLAWYYGDRAGYGELLKGSSFEKAVGLGGMVEIKAGNSNVLLSEGVVIRFHAVGEDRPARHQFLIEFADHSAMSASVQMYGGMGAFREGELNNPYYRAAGAKPSPLTPAFDLEYFDHIVSAPEVQRLSLKALLATEQRIPGLGNGVLQDILFNAKMHPRKKANTLSAEKKKALFNSLKTTLAAMLLQGGRDTETDLFGQSGSYKTILSKNTLNKPCPVCSAPIKKEAYLGGAIYFCEKCQTL